MFILMISRSSLNLGHVGQKLGHYLYYILLLLLLVCTTSTTLVLLVLLVVLIVLLLLVLLVIVITVDHNFDRILIKFGQNVQLYEI